MEGSRCHTCRNGRYEKSEAGDWPATGGKTEFTVTGEVYRCRSCGSSAQWRPAGVYAAQLAEVR